MADHPERQPLTAEDVVRQLARESLATRDALVAHDWLMTPMPHEDEVRRILNEPNGGQECPLCGGVGTIFDITATVEAAQAAGHVLATLDAERARTPEAALRAERDFLFDPAMLARAMSEVWPVSFRGEFASDNPSRRLLTEYAERIAAEYARLSPGDSES